MVSNSSAHLVCLTKCDKRHKLVSYLWTFHPTKKQIAEDYHTVLDDHIFQISRWFQLFLFFGKRLNNCSVEFHCHIINGISKMGQDFRKQMHVGENAIHPMLKVEMFPCFPGLSPYILTLSKSSIIDSDILFEGFSFCYNKPAFPEIPSSTTFLKVTGHHLKCSRCCVWWRKRDAFRTPSIF